MRNLVGAPIEPALAQEALSVAKKIRSGEVTPDHAEDVIGVIGKMTTQVMHHFFVKPVDKFGGGMTMKGVAEFGVRSATKGIRFGLTKMLPRLKPAQWKQVADFLDDSLYDPGTLKK
ncbi:MAG: hypothetical protein AABY95_09100 [Pseudomonadota bacterium]